jgi:hypothetical protein
MKLWFQMLRMCVYMHSRFVENHPIRILEDGPLISEVVLSQQPLTLKYALVRPSKTKKKSWNIQHKDSTLEPEQAPEEQSLVCNLNALATSGLQ